MDFISHTTPTEWRKRPVHHSAALACMLSGEQTQRLNMEHGQSFAHFTIVRGVGSHELQFQSSFCAFRIIHGSRLVCPNHISFSWWMCTDFYFVGTVPIIQLFFYLYLNLMFLNVGVIFEMSSHPIHSPHPIIYADTRRTDVNNPTPTPPNSHPHPICRARADTKRSTLTPTPPHQICTECDDSRVNNHKRPILPASPPPQPHPHQKWILETSKERWSDINNISCDESCQWTTCKNRLGAGSISDSLCSKDWVLSFHLLLFGNTIQLQYDICNIQEWATTYSQP
jgi:hypothetical protein